MKNIIGILAIAIIIISCSTENKLSNDLNDLKLYGQIKSLKQNNYLATLKFGEATKGNTAGNISQFIFNKVGNIIEINTFSQSDSLISKLKYKYDDNKNNIEICYYNTEGKIDSLLTKKYNESNILTTENIYDSHNRLIKVVTHAYNDINVLIESRIYNTENFSLSKIIKFYYNDNGKLIEKTEDKAIAFSLTNIYNDKEVLVEKYINDGSELKITCEYDNNTIISLINNKMYSKYVERKDTIGNIIENVTYKPDNTIEEKTTRVFDKLGNKLKEEGFYFYEGERNDFLKRFVYNEGTKVESRRYRKSGIIKDKFHYDENGNTISMFLYDSKGNNMLTMFYKYDNYGNKIQSDFCFGETTITNHYNNIYDNYGNITQINENEVMDEKYLYEYSSEGNIIEEKKFNEKEKPVYCYKFDEQKNKTEEISYDFDGIISQHFKYNKGGNIIEQRTFNDEGDLLTKVTTTYLDKKTSIIENFDESQNSKSTYNYDELGNMIEFKIFYLDTSFNSSTLYYYDQNNNQIKTVAYNSDGAVILDTRIKHEFDNNNNWIKKIITDKTDDPLYITERLIEYY